MSLTLTVENVEQLDNGESLQLSLDRHGACIGRSPHSDWSLPDPKNYVSSTHCEIEYRDGGYVLIDRSTNGTFLNDSPQRMTAPHVLKDGDVIGIGQYRVRALTAGGGAAAPALEAAAPAPAGGAGGWDAWGGGGAAAARPQPSAGWESAPSAWAAPAASASAPASTGWASEVAPAPAATPAAWAPADPSAASSGWAGPSEGVSTGWGAADVASPASGGWDAPAPVALAPVAPAPVSLTPFSPAPGAPPAAGSAWGPQGAGPAQPLASGWDAIGPARDEAAAAAPGGTEGPAPPVSGRGALSQSWAPPRVDAPAAPPPPAPGVTDLWGKMAESNTVDWSRGGFGAGADWSKPKTIPPAPGGSAAASEGGGVWAAFLQAAGVSPDAVKAEPAQAAATAGALLKHLVAGLVVMVEARARAKAQLGAQSTTLELRGNNPIKFARSPERVLAQLLSPPERGFMAADDAVQDSFGDLQAHQMATLAAMQGALRSTLERFSPDAIRKRAEMRGVLAKILPSARDASLWLAYEREFEGVAKGSDEAFMDVFAKAFKAAYEQAAAQMKSQAR